MAKKAVKKTVKRAPKKAVKKTARSQFILPKKMSKLIDIGLRDLRATEKMNNFIIDMDTYFHPTKLECRIDEYDKVIKTEPACVVCFAGSVMAQTLKAPITGRDLDPVDFDGNSRQLEALNGLRCGSTTSAAIELGLLDENHGYDYEKMDFTPAYKKLSKLDMDIPQYDMDNPEPFHKAMIKFRNKLAKAGY